MNVLKDFEVPVENEPSIFAWGATLSKNSPEASWNPFADDYAKLEGDIIYLEIKQAVLGSSAIDKERNIIQFQTFDAKNQPLNIPFISLARNFKEMCTIDLKFEPCGNKPVKFKLIEGSGPVYLTGQHHIEVSEDYRAKSESFSPPKQIKIPANDKISKKKNPTEQKAKPESETKETETKRSSRTKREKKGSIEVEDLIDELAIDQKKNTKAIEDKKKLVFNDEGFKNGAIIKRKKATDKIQTF